MSSKKPASEGVKVGRDAKTGRMVPAGYGALKGQYAVRKGIDVTKPIYEQAGRRARKTAASKKLGKG